VTVTLNLKPEVEAGLLAQAQAAGLPLDQFLSRYLEMLTRATSTSPAPLRAPSPGEGDQWEKELDAWLDSFPQHPILSDEALQRENWYPDRW
jgi:hypothetical protein